MTADHHPSPPGILSWTLSVLVGGVAGLLVGTLVPTTHAGDGHAPVALWQVAPFVALLLAIATMPFIAPHWWHRRYPDVALALGGLVIGHTLATGGGEGRSHLLHVGIEYYSFIALVGGLYVASGGISINRRWRGTPTTNTALLALGAVIANLVGTTGASLLLIRPFMQANRGRLRPIHAACFIFIVSNCGGCLTPIGDPPLYLGYLQGVPFFWTLEHLWPSWLLVNGCLLAIFFAIDSRIPLSALPISHDPSAPALSGGVSLALMLLIVVAALFDPFVGRPLGLGHLPLGATIQLALAGLAFAITSPVTRAANRFSFEPVKEVALLFVGIFATMLPALEYLRAHAPELGLNSPTRLYFVTGLLSSVLDNAPTYAAMLQVELGQAGLPPVPASVRTLASSVEGVPALEAISLGAVFFGALTYIGNGPNFMIRAVVADAHRRSSATGAHESARGLGTEMPSFFKYSLMAACVLGPVLILNWAIFLR